MKKDTDNWFELLLISPKLRIVRHLLLQVLILLLALNALGSEDEEFVITSRNFSEWIIFYIALNILCYLNIYWLAPRLLLTGQISKYKWFILALVVLFILFSVAVQTEDNDSSSSPVFWIKKIIEISASFLGMGMIIFATSTMILFVQWINEQKRIGELKLATKQAELNILKQQINPHFLFNMLNNANVLLKRAPKEASQVLFKLEELLDYQLNDSKKELVNLDSDISFLNDFLNLEKIRRDSFYYSIQIEGDTSGVKVPPLLFIPFVENAIKHNPDNKNESYTHIKFRIANRGLYFTCENSKPEIPLIKNKVGGLGLKNISRRLDLLYPDRHTLSIANGDKQFTVFLIIKHLHT